MVIIKRYDDETISIQTAIEHLRVGDISPSQREVIILKLAAAIDIAEQYTNRVIACGEAKFAIHPKVGVVELKSATQIKEICYLSTNGSKKSLPPTYYRHVITEIGVIVQFIGWPKDLTAENIIEKCWVIAVVGYDKNTIPKGIVSAVLLMLGTLYDNESDELVGRSINRLAMSAEKILNRYRITP